MQVMVMNDDPEIQARVAKGLRMQGFQVVGMETVARACDYVKVDPVDLLIMGERVSGRLSHTVALAAECANPMLSTIILTDRRDREVEELYDLLPSLYALVGPDNAPAIIATLALAAVANPEDAEARMRRNALAHVVQNRIAAEDDAADEDDADEMIPRAAATFAPDAPIDAWRDTATWGAEQGVIALANSASRQSPGALPLGGFAREFAAGADAPQTPPARPRDHAPAAIRSERTSPLSAPATAPDHPVASNFGSRPSSAPTPEIVPDRVPDRTDRMAWIAAKVRELDSKDARGSGRLHLA